MLQEGAQVQSDLLVSPSLGCSASARRLRCARDTCAPGVRYCSWRTASLAVSSPSWHLLPPLRGFQPASRSVFPALKGVGQHNWASADSPTDFVLLRDTGRKSSTGGVLMQLLAFSCPHTGLHLRASLLRND